MTRLKADLSALLVIVALLATACGDGEAEAPAGEDAGATKEELAAYEPGDEVLRGVDEDTFPVEAAERPYVIGVGLPDVADPYWIGNAFGMVEEAERLGLEDIRILNAEGYEDTAGQLSHMDTFIAQGVDAIILSVVDELALAPSVDAAWDAGIPVIYDCCGAESEKTTGVYTDDELAGIRQAEYIAEKDPNAKIMSVCGPPGVAFGVIRCEAFKETLSELAPNAELVAEKYHEFTREATAETVANTLQGFPEVNWIMNATDLQAKGSVDALRGLGKAPGEVNVTTLTMGRELVALMERGWITYALAERSVLQGKLTVDLAVLILNGENPPARWLVDLPGFEGTEEDLRRFHAEEAKWNFEPEDWTP